MTNKEAIEKLGYIKNQYHVMFKFTDYDEALDLAIKALTNERPHGKWYHSIERGGRNND